MKKELQRRVTPDELDYLCKLRGNQKTHSDYSIEKGYTNYHVKVSKDEWKIILAQRAQLDYVETRTKDIIAHEARENTKRSIDSLIKKNEELQSILDIRTKTAEVSIYDLTPTKSTSGKDTISISLFSDFHCDEVVTPESVLYKNAYNPDIAKSRADSYFVNLVKLVSHHQRNYTIKRHVLGLLGDMIGGYIHDELQQTNSMPPLEAISFAKSILMSGLKYLQENLNVETIDVVCVVGNHPRTTKKKQYSNRTQTNYEFFLYQDLAEMCHIMGFNKFNFIIPRASTAILTIFGKNYAFEHGDEIQYQGGIGGLYVPLLRGFSKLSQNFKIERLFFAHHHTTIDIKEAVGNGSIKGFDPYALSHSFPYEPAQQSMVLLNEKHGFTNFQPIFLD